MHARRTIAVLAAAAAAALTLAGCSAAGSEGAESSAASDGTFPVTIEHAFGETEIPEAPERVVTWGWGSTEAALAVGVVPVAIAQQSYGAVTGGIPIQIYRLRPPDSWSCDGATQKGLRRLHRALATK